MPRSKPAASLGTKERIEDVEDRLKEIRAIGYSSSSVLAQAGTLLATIQEHREKLDNHDRDKLRELIHRIAAQL